MEPIRRAIEGFLRGRYGYEGHQSFRVLVVPVLIEAIVVVGWVLVGPLLTIPPFTTEGPVVRNGVAVIVACGKKSGSMNAKGMMAVGGSRARARDGRVVRSQGRVYGVVSPPAGVGTAL